MILPFHGITTKTIYTVLTTKLAMFFNYYLPKKHSFENEKSHKQKL